MTRLSLLACLLSAVFFNAPLSADSIQLLGLSDYPFGVINIRVGESVTIRAKTKISKNSQIPIDIMMLIDDSAAMSGVATTGLPATWDTVVRPILIQWDTRIGIYKYHVSSSSLVENLTPAKDFIYHTLSIVGVIIVDGEPVPIYRPIYESDGDGSPTFGIEALRRTILLDSWRTDAFHLIFALMDSRFKEGPYAWSTENVVKDYLSTGDFVFSGLIGPGPCCGGVNPNVFSNASGGTIGVVADWSDPARVNSDLPNALMSAITALVPPTDYSLISINDGAAPSAGVDLNVMCVSAAPGGSCVSIAASGIYSRDQQEEFEFDLTFTGLAVGFWSVNVSLIVNDKVTISRPVSISVAPPEMIFENGFEFSELSP